MKFRSLTVLLILVSVCTCCFARVEIDLDPNWRFIRQDVPNGEGINTDDTGWQKINLPHTWNNVDGQDGGNDYYRGVGWYRLHLPTDAAWKGKQVYIKFDAASLVADVFVNGKRAGHHAGAFAAFCFDITPLLNATGDNVIAVKVNNAKDPGVAPLSGDFTVFGGLYRGVHLIVTSPLAISPIDNAGSGVYVRQDKVDAESAHLHVRTVVRNAGATNAPVTLKFELLDAGGAVAITSQESWQSVGAGETDEMGQDLVLPHPHLWNARKDPYCYSMRVSLLDGQTVVDAVEQPVGLRFFRVDPEKGFFLNGQPYRLLGVNRHQDHLDKGWAVSLADHQLDFDNMMEMGCTGVRLSHYQHAQEFYDLCDKGGMVAWAEIPIVNEMSMTSEFDDNASQQLSELIEQNFNHPSICFWSLSNELGNGNGKDKTASAKHQVDLQTRLNTEAKRMDPTRLTTEAISQKPGRALDAITDVIGFNRYFGWYSGRPDQLAAELDKIHATYPDRGVAISEYGAGAAISQHEADVKQPKPGGKWHPEEWQSLIHEQAWAAMKDRQWIWGTFLWAEHDFAADQRNEGEHAGRNDKGMVTYDGRTKKDAFYFYKANWSQEPTVYITDRRFTPRPAGDGPIKIYANCESVELKVNGLSVGARKGSDIHVFIWDPVALKSGENVLTASGERDGKTFTDTCTIVVDPDMLNPHQPTSEPTTKGKH